MVLRLLWLLLDVRDCLVSSNQRSGLRLVFLTDAPLQHCLCWLVCLRHCVCVCVFGTISHSVAIASAPL